MTRILIVKEIPLPQDQVLALELSRHGVNVKVALSTFYDLEYNIAAFKPDMVIVDFSKLTGQMVLELVLPVQQRSSFPFMYLVEARNRQRRELYMAAKPAGLLMKPYKMTDLVAMIEITLQRALVQEQMLQP